MNLDIQEAPERKAFEHTDSFEANYSRCKHDTYCVRCGKQIDHPKMWVHVVNGGADILRADLEESWDWEANQTHDLGLNPVGPECAAAIGWAYVQVDQ